MITPLVQRWRDRRGSYRPAGEPIDTSRYEVISIAEDRIAKDFVLTHHYSGTFPAARARFGLYRSAALVGMAVFSQPVNNHTFDCLPGETAGKVELGRLVLLDDVPANGESWFIARCFEELRKAGFHGVVSFSDPYKRTTATGDVVMPGHLGTVYQASNAVYVGRARVDTIRILPDGQVLANRAIAKVRSKEKGWRYAAAQLEAFDGVPPCDGALDGPRAWIDRILASALVRTVRHPGNHKYLFPLDRAAKKALPAHLEALGLAVKPYPKWKEIV
jgi:hypothetical protein